MCYCHWRSWIAGSYLTAMAGENLFNWFRFNWSEQGAEYQYLNTQTKLPKLFWSSSLWLASFQRSPAPCLRSYSINSCLRRPNMPIPVTDWDSFWWGNNPENISRCSFSLCEWWALMGLILAEPLCLVLQTEMDFQWNIHLSSINYSMGLWRSC